MANVNDLRKAALLTLTGLSSGDSGDLWKTWLLSETGESSGDSGDLTLMWLTDLGYTTGTVNERWYAFLGDEGYTGTLNDRLLAYWAAGGGSGSGGFSYLLLESGDKLVLEDGSGNLLLQ